jgi:hypothetical protein
MAGWILLDRRALHVMVFVWSNFVDGEPHFTRLTRSALNDITLTDLLSAVLPTLALLFGLRGNQMPIPVEAHFSAGSAKFAQAALSTPSTPDRSSWSRLPQASPRRARQHRWSPQHQRRQPLPSGRGPRRLRKLPSPCQSGSRLDRG